MDYLSIPALGKAAALGDLYDCRSGSLIPGTNVFECALPNGFIRQQQNPSMQYEFCSTETLSEKLESLNIHGEVRLSILAGLGELSGAGSFLNDKKTSAKEKQGTFMFNCRTYDESFNVNDKRLRECIKLDAIKNCEKATHVVVGIEWGAAVNVVVSQRLEKEEDSNEWKGQLEGLLKKFPMTLSGSIDAKGIENRSNETSEISIKIFADVLPDHDAVPLNFADALKFVASVPERIKKTNDGKGRQLYFRLLAVEAFAKIDAENYAKRLSHEISIDVIAKVETAFEAANKSLQNLHDHVRFLESKKPLVPVADLGEARTYLEDCTEEFSSFRRELRSLLGEIRGGKENQDELICMIRDVKRAKKLSKIKSFIEDSTVPKRLKFVERLEKAGIKTSGSDFNDLRLHTGAVASFVLFFSFAQDCAKLELENAIQVLEDIGDKERLAIDEDYFPEARKKFNVPEGVRICELVNQAVASVDYLAVLHARKTKPTVKSLKPVNRETKPDNSNALVLHCPRWLDGHDCTRESLTWLCHKCLSELDYGFNRKVYCDCGSRPIEALKFRCNSAHHGKEHVTFSHFETLEDELKKIPHLPETTVLVIGETGVGKSTWINAVPTYITHEDWDEANRDPHPVHLIPTSFQLSTPTENGNFTTFISVGKSDNENLGRVGESQTQAPRSYKFVHDKRLFRIIDTPGIGDTRGIEMDKKNIEAIMDYLADINEIHLICFLLPTDVPRLSPAFNYCFKELIKQFHKSAAANVVFCFTKACSTGYQIGQTGNFLQSLVNDITVGSDVNLALNKSTEYISDNMSYRYICAISSNAENRKLFEAEVIANMYKASFDFSRSETLRLLDRAASLQPHNPKQTLSVNYIRSLICKLGDSLALITNAITKTVHSINEETKLIHESVNDEAKLQSLLHKKIKVTRCKMHIEDHVYCGNCIIKREYRGIDRFRYIEADPSLANRDPLIMNQFTSLDMQDDGSYTCKNCGSNCRKCDGTKYYTEFTTEEIEEDETVLSRMENKASIREQARAKQDALRKTKAEMDEEYQAVLTASATFAIFLRQNAIATFNDATEVYLRTLIDLEREAAYKEERAVIENSLKVSSTRAELCKKIKPEDVKEIVDKLKRLKHYGKDVEAALLAQKVHKRRNKIPDTVYDPTLRGKEQSDGIMVKVKDGFKHLVGY